MTALAAALAGCAPPVLLTGGARDWQRVEDRASEAVALGHLDAAARMLEDYIAHERGRPEAADAWLWLSALRSDPAYKGAQAVAAAAALDSAIARGGSRSAGTIATLLKRQTLAADAASKELDQARHALTDARQAAATQQPRAADAPPNLADEVARLKRELDKANEELARVKRTLRQRRP